MDFWTNVATLFFCLDTWPPEFQPTTDDDFPSTMTQGNNFLATWLRILPYRDPWDDCIFTYIWLFLMVNVGKYTNPMDPMGYDYERSCGTVPGTTKYKNKSHYFHQPKKKLKWTHRGFSFLKNNVGVQTRRQDELIHKKWFPNWHGFWPGENRKPPELCKVELPIDR